MPLRERDLIARIAGAAGNVTFESRRHKLSPKIGGGVIQGIGDDCAVLRVPVREDLLVTTDLSIEGVHFRREWHPPESVGHRCLARGLSDVAAMGGTPFAAFVSLALPAKISQSWVDSFFRGLLKLARQFNTTLAGGDTSRSPSGVFADIVVLGSAPKNNAILRSGARPGDRVYVTGALGASAASVDILFKKRQRLDPNRFRAHFFPTTRIRVAKLLREKRIPSAMIDISDGLSTDLDHICEMSRVGAEVFTEKIPVAKIGTPAKPVGLDFALNGGEDYELLFTASRNREVPRSISGVKITCIGEIISKRQVFLVDESGSRSKLKVRGWEHFRNFPAR